MFHDGHDDLSTQARRAQPVRIASESESAECQAHAHVNRVMVKSNELPNDFVRAGGRYNA